MESIRGGQQRCASGGKSLLDLSERPIASRNPISFSRLELYFMYHLMTPEKRRSRHGWHRYAREWAHRSRVRALEYWSTLYRSNKARWQEEHGETIREKSYYLAMHDWNRRTDEREWSTAYCARSQVFFFAHFFSHGSLYVISQIYFPWIRVTNSYRIIINWTLKNRKILIVETVNWLSFVVKRVCISHIVLSVCEIQYDDLSCGSASVSANLI